jgi:hypothetical protein
MLAVGGCLIAQVGFGVQGVVEAVGEIRNASDQRQLHDLLFVEKLSQLREGGVADGGGAPRDALGVQNHGLVFLIEQLAAVVEEKRANLLLSDANPLRRSGVCACSIFASVDQRRFQVRQLFVAMLDRAPFHHRGIKRQEFSKYIRAVRHQSEHVRHFPELFGQRIE